MTSIADSTRGMSNVSEGKYRRLTKCIYDAETLYIVGTLSTFWYTVLDIDYCRFKLIATQTYVLNINTFYTKPHCLYSYALII